MLSSYRSLTLNLHGTESDGDKPGGFCQKCRECRSGRCKAINPNHLHLALVRRVERHDRNSGRRPVEQVSDVCRVCSHLS